MNQLSIYVLIVVLAFLTLVEADDSSENSLVLNSVTVCGGKRPEECEACCEENGGSVAKQVIFSAKRNNWVAQCTCRVKVDKADVSGFCKNYKKYNFECSECCSYGGLVMAFNPMGCTCKLPE